MRTSPDLEVEVDKLAEEKSDKHSDKDEEFAIVINGELAVVPHREVSYIEAVAIAFPTQATGDITYTVTYRKAKGAHHEGILVDGQFVEVRKEGTIFNVTPTGKS